MGRHPLFCLVVFRLFWERRQYFLEDLRKLYRLDLNRGVDDGKNNQRLCEFSILCMGDSGHDKEVDIKL